MLTLLLYPLNISLFQTDKFINELVLQFLAAPIELSDNTTLGLNPLDILHRAFCPHTNPTIAPEQKHKKRFGSSMPCARELRKAGINFEMSATRKLDDVRFENGKLSMPLFRVHSSTEKCLLNLVAFEKLHHGAGAVFTSYMKFMNNIIQNGEDVAELRSKGVMHHTLESDEAVAKLFNTVYKGHLNPDSKLHHVQRQADEYCKKRRHKWYAKFVQTQMSDPIVFFSFLGGIFLLLLCNAQTFYTIYPYYRPHKG